MPGLKYRGGIMARTTNSDTLPFVDSRYELGMLAAQRVRDLNGGAEPLLSQGRDKPAVLALREIATGDLDVGLLRHELVQSYKENQLVVDGENCLESESESPELKELDAELEGALLESDADSAEITEDEIATSTMDSEELTSKNE
jgi:DNA-directed RNA polymerase subunit omega